MVYNLRFFLSLKYSLFHNSNFFGSCIIHILYTECDKIKKIIPAPERLVVFYVYGSVHHNIFYEITNRCSYMQSILFHC
jgi:hypothetical protein